MKRKLQTIICASAVSLLALAASAQETTTNPQPDSIGSVRESITQTRIDRMNDALKSSDVIGMTVQNYQGEKIGTVQDLVVDVEHGRIVQVILSTGAFFGMDGMMTAVPPRALHHDIENKILQLDTSKEKLKMAPHFDPETWNEGPDSNRVTEVYVYFGEHPYFISSRNDIWVTNTDGTLARTLLGNQTMTNKTEGIAKTRNKDQPPRSWSEMGDVEKASVLIGMPVNNLQDARLGTVENFLVDLPTGRMVAVIISSGGFLGMGDVLSPVPPTALRFEWDRNFLGRHSAPFADTMSMPHTVDQNANPQANSSAASPGIRTDTQSTTDQEVLKLDATKKMLSNAPHFKADQWPDFGQPTYIGGIYRAYNVQPYYNTNAIIEPVKTISEK